MSDQVLLIYILGTFVLGIACSGALVLIARQRRDALVQSFLFLYLALTVLVGSKLLLSMLITWPAEASGTWLEVFQYLESFIGRYGVMLTLPLFVHRLVGPMARQRDSLLLTVIGLAFVSQHVTEFGSSDRIDELGDVAEDALFGLIWLYSLLVCLLAARRGHPRRPLIKRLAVLMAIALPAVGHDLFLAEDMGFRYYPIWYAIVSVVMVHGLWDRSRSATTEGLWFWSDLTDREKEITELLCAGLGNREIGERLHVSENTIKTHLKHIYEKAGVGSRVALLARLNPHPTHDHPSG